MLLRKHHSSSYRQDEKNQIDSRNHADPLLLLEATYAAHPGRARGAALDARLALPFKVFSFRTWVA